MEFREGGKGKGMTEQQQFVIHKICEGRRYKDLH
jgi:hypothetical protein